jgi:NAD(P)-dependent dehydrogenase (short-subunit alcohol dehydrogenase family)
MSKQVVVISGAAGGIGTATVKEFLSLGFLVVGTDRVDLKNDHPLYSVGEYTHVVAELSNSSPCVIADSLGEIVHVISTAGGATDEVGIEDLTLVSEEVIRESVEGNLIGQILFARNALPYLRESKGSLAFTSSKNGLAGIALFAYSSAKAGLFGLVKVLAIAEGKYGVRVNVVAPGSVLTERVLSEWKGKEVHFDALTDSTVLGACVTPEQLATTFSALALTLTGITGQTIVVDAGQTAKWR